MRVRQLPHNSTARLWGSEDTMSLATSAPAVEVEKYLTSADGTAIHASESATGAPANPPVVFIHGLGFSSTVAWDKQFSDPRLQGNLYMVRYDMRGHGRSGAPVEAAMYESRRHAEDFRAVCEGFGVVGPDVVAW